MLTREEALRKHREMWTAMREELGNNPGKWERIRFKIDWCEQHEEDKIYCHCYLCQYVNERGLSCDDCPIIWDNEVSSCSMAYVSYKFAPISEILALPERKVEENVMVAETES